MRRTCKNKKMNYHYQGYDTPKFSYWKIAHFRTLKLKIKLEIGKNHHLRLITKYLFGLIKIITEPKSLAIDFMRKSQKMWSKNMKKTANWWIHFLKNSDWPSIQKMTSTSGSCKWRKISFQKVKSFHQYELQSHSRNYRHL